MTAKRDKASMTVKSQSATHAPQNSSATDSKGKKRDVMIPTKDKSPDDMEILD